MQSSILFSTPDGQRLTRSGDVTTAYLIAQATAEFGSIHMHDKTEGDTPEDVMPGEVHTASTIAAAIQNAKMVFDQLTSLDESAPQTDAKDHIGSAIALLETSLQDSHVA